MYFDKACGIIERFFPEMKDYFLKAKLFHLPGKPHDFLPKKTQAQPQVIRDMFFLPFPVVAVEDVAGVVLLWDLEKDQKGLSEYRGFLDVVPFDHPEGFVDGEKYRHYMQSNELRGQYGIARGKIRVFPAEDGVNYLVEGILDWYAIGNKQNIQLEERLVLPQEVVQGEIKNPMCAIEEILYFNSPDRFVFQTTPLDKNAIPLRPGKGKIPRSHERSIYTLLSPGEIRQKLGLQKTGHHASPIPHERRRHFRTYPSDSEHFKRMAGKTIVVKATWVGDSERIIGNKRYRVRLDI